MVGPVPTEFCRPSNNAQLSGTCKEVRPAPLLRKSFTVAPVCEHGAVVSARVYSSGLAWNEMTLNGDSDVGAHVPGSGLHELRQDRPVHDRRRHRSDPAERERRGRERDRLAARLGPVRQRDDLGRLGLVDGRVADEPDAADGSVRDVRGRHGAADQVRRLVANERRGADPLRQPLPGRDVRRSPRAGRTGMRRASTPALGRRRGR